ncbi:MAG: hypothetical protein V4569_03285 [Pseudomonadota bacterium]
MGVQDRDWYWKDTQGGSRDGDSRSGRPFRPNGSSSYHPIAIVLAALIGAGAMMVGVHAYQEWRARVAIAEVLRAGNEAMRQVQLQAAQQQREEAARQQARQAQIDRQEALKVQAIRQRQEADDEARRAIIAAADRKERAWAKFYRKPAACNDSASMECANGFIRAKRTFEEKYTRGEL